MWIQSGHPPHYAELHALSAFSFRHSVAAPADLVRQAHALGYRAIAITDECSLAGVVRAHEAARELNIKLIIGSVFHIIDTNANNNYPIEVIALAPTPRAYSQLCQWITLARRRADKGAYHCDPADLFDDCSELNLDALLMLWKPDPLQQPMALIEAQARRWLARFEGRLWLGATRHLRAQERQAFQQLDQLGDSLGIPRLACGAVRMIQRADRPLLDVMTALQQHCRIDQCGLTLAANSEAYLRPREQLARLYPTDWLSATLAVAERCEFQMDSLSYRHPRELVPDGLSASAHLRQLTKQGLQQRYGDQAPAEVLALIERELTLITEMAVEAFFLTVHDLVRFARQRGILCQGRGSAANSAVCYCLGITEVDPAHQPLLFERFLSKQRNEPPDIDVDFEHERREEVLQYIYDKYGRQRAALAATVITYRPRSALKDVGRALGIDADRMHRLTRSLAWWDEPDSWPQRLSEAGLDPTQTKVRHLLALTRQLIGLPRHLSQHVGGMVIADQPLHHLVPIENAAMAGRTIIQWDKDDLETLGLLKVDCLALGMLTVLRKAMALVDPTLTLATLPREDPATYAMLCRADAIGVFQVESRAQMAMLPRLKPRCFYDLVIEIALVRPGPIQGQMVHPYLQRRQHPERVRYPDPRLEPVLKRTLGVPIFQEQVMQIAMVAAGFSAEQADGLRRAMAAWKRHGGLEPFREDLLSGMHERGYPHDFAESIYNQIKGFGEYGFPESHAASFALLTYFSAWLKCHHPAAFTCALLNSQPMGFYAPAQLIADARRHGVAVWPVDVQRSDLDSTLVHPPDGGESNIKSTTKSNTKPAIQLGLNRVAGLSQAAMARIVKARQAGPWRSVQALAERASLNRRDLMALADSGALKAFSGDRHQARWQAMAAPRQGDLLAATQVAEPEVALPTPSAWQTLHDDYASLGFSLTHHPITLLRPHWPQSVLAAHELAQQRDGANIEVAGVVTHRQRPGTASGVIFLSLEDDSGLINVIVWPQLLARYRQAILQGQIVRVCGRLQIGHGSVHVIARAIYSEAALMARLLTARCDAC